MKTTKNMLKICYYCRVSTDNQDYLLQKQSLDRVLNNRNDVILVKIFAEKISGYSKEGERPEMNNLLQAVKNNEVDEVWGYDVSRISRDSINLQIICRTCTQNNVNVYFHVQNLNTLNPDGSLNPITKMLIGLLGEFAEQDGKNWILKGRAGKLTNSRRGFYIGGTLPLGYSCDDNKKIIIDENEKKIVEYIFKSFVQDEKTLKRICNDLNNLKVVDSNFQPKMITKNYGSKNKNWQATTIAGILKSSWYAKGERLYKGEIIKLDESLKFISLNNYEKAQNLLSENKTKLKPHIHEYILNDKLYCSCGQRMHPKVTRKVKSYMCHLIFQHQVDKSLNCEISKSVQIEKIENAIWLLIKNKIPEFILKVEQKTSIESEIKTKIETNNTLIQSNKDITINDLKGQKKRTINTFVKYGGDDAELEQSINQIDNQIKQQEKIISELESENTKLLYSIENLDVASEIEKNIKAIESDKSLIKFYVNKLVKKITVCGLAGKFENVIEIEWNENINNNVSTFLFYNTKATIKPFYYYISSEAININPTVKANIKISWNTENKTFEIYDSELNETIELTVNQMMNNLDKIDTLIYGSHQYDSTMNFLIHFVNIDFYDVDNNLILKKDLIMYDNLTLKTNFNNNAGIQKLQIVTPFV